MQGFVYPGSVAIVLRKTALRSCVAGFFAQKTGVNNKKHKKTRKCLTFLSLAHIFEKSKMSENVNCITYS